MKIGVLGTGMVGRSIATKLAELGHEVKMGSRSAGNEKAVEWAAGAGEGASEMYLQLWLSVMGTLGGADFNIRFVH